MLYNITVSSMQNPTYLSQPVHLCGPIFLSDVGVGGAVVGVPFGTCQSRKSKDET